MGLRVHVYNASSVFFFKSEQLLIYHFHFHLLLLSSNPRQLSLLRAQIVITDYTNALFAAVHTGSHTHNPLPETRTLINHLIQSPITDYRGRGPMVLIRCHDVAIGKAFYWKIKAVRDALGLQYRFEVLLDNGKSLPCLSEYFAKRVKSQHIGRESNDMCVSNYEELEDIPCIVVMVGRRRSRPHLPR